MASRSAACVFGGVRLISSASTIFEKMGPLENWNLRPPPSGSSCRTSVPVMSEGIRSGVNWMRRNDRDKHFAIELTRSVFANPGTPSSRPCPLEKTEISTSSMTLSMPTIALRSSCTISSRAARSFSTALTSSIEATSELEFWFSSVDMVLTFLRGDV